MEVRKLELPERFQAQGDFEILETPVSYRLVFGPGGPAYVPPEVDPARAARDFQLNITMYIREILEQNKDWRPLVVADQGAGFSQVVPGIASIPEEWGYPDLRDHSFVVEMCPPPYRMRPGLSAPERRSTSLVERLRLLPDCPAFLVDERDFSQNDPNHFKDDLAVVLEAALTMARGGRQVIWSAYGRSTPEIDGFLLYRRGDRPDYEAVLAKGPPTYSLEEALKRAWPLEGF